MFEGYATFMLLNLQYRKADWITSFMLRTKKIEHATKAAGMFKK